MPYHQRGCDEKSRTPPYFYASALGAGSDRGGIRDFSFTNPNFFSILSSIERKNAFDPVWGILNPRYGIFEVSSGETT
jgi:hypothetical protein